MLKITSYQGNANENHNGTSLLVYGIAKTKKNRTPNIGEDVEKVNQLHFVVGKRKWYI